MEKMKLDIAFNNEGRVENCYLGGNDLNICGYDLRYIANEIKRSLRKFGLAVVMATQRAYDFIMKHLDLREVLKNLVEREVENMNKKKSINVGIGSNNMIGKKKFQVLKGRRWNSVDGKAKNIYFDAIELGSGKKFEYCFNTVTGKRYFSKADGEKNLGFTPNWEMFESLEVGVPVAPAAN